MIFETYQLDIIDTKNGKCTTALIPINKSNVEALKSDRRKIYLVCNGNIILYVGEAYASMKVRFQRSCNSYNHFKTHNKARGGYKGYKWLDPNNNPNRELTLHVIVFSNEYDEKGKEIKAIEGELAYEVRNQSGSWPLWQNEIHFSNVNGANEKAKNILKAFGLELSLN